MFLCPPSPVSWWLNSETQVTFGFSCSCVEGVGLLVGGIEELRISTKSYMQLPLILSCAVRSL